MTTPLSAEQSPLYAAFIRQFTRIFNPAERGELQPQILGLYRNQPELSSDQFITQLVTSGQPLRINGHSFTLADKGITLETLQ